MTSEQQHPYLHGPYPRAFAHRGWHLGETADMENSLAAFRAATAHGYRYLETDVHATVDGVVVVHHDDRLERTTDGFGPIGEQPWSAVRQAKVGGLEPVCTLPELLEAVPDAYLNIDVKADSAVEPVISVLNATDAYDRVCLASFSDNRLSRLRTLGGDRLLTSMGPLGAAALLAGSYLPGKLLDRAMRGAMAQVPRRQGPLPVVTETLLRAAHRRGIEVHVWTINDPSEMAELLDLGVDGLVTDAPDVLRNVLTERGQWV